MTINLNIGVGSEKFSSDSFERIAKGENNKVNIPVTPIKKIQEVMVLLEGKIKKFSEDV